MNNKRRFHRVVFVMAGVLCSLFTSGTIPAADAPKWFRGQLHAHSYLSDGRGFPDQAVATYKQRGYDFLSLTDHNRFADNMEEWRTVEPTEGSWPPKVSQANFDAYVEAFGKDWVDTKTEDGVLSVRLKTYAELKAKFEEPGKFLLIPGVEITQNVNGLGLHLNYINLPTIFPSIKNAPIVMDIHSEETVSERIALNASEAAQAAEKLQRPYLFFLNHPFWVYYDTKPQNLIDNPDVLFFEIAKGGRGFAPDPQVPNYSVGKFWDIVNAFRRIQGHPLMYGVGSDDAHFYDPARVDTYGGVDDTWIMVRAEALTPESLIEAMRRGDFYATNGVVLEDVAFTPAHKTLRVKVKPDEGVTYQIHFITTKKDFDRTVTEVASTNKKKPTRTIPVYSDDIGQTVKTVKGLEASYQLQPDDLYVRARIESDSPRPERAPYYPKVKMAWTQPYAIEE